MFFKLFSSFSLIFSLLILLRRLLTYFRLQLDEFFSDFIVASLPEDSKNSPSSLILWNALKQRQPSRARSLKLLKLNLALKFRNLSINLYLINNVFQLKYSNTNESIFTCKAIITNANVKLVKVQLLL